MLNQYAVKSRLKIGMFRRTALDKKQSSDLARVKNADETMVKVSKVLLGESATLKSLRQMANKIRAFHYDNTLPWDDGGYRMLPNDHYTAYDKEMQGYMRQFETLRAAFKKEYAADIVLAQKNLGTMFDQDDYPDVSTIDALVYLTLKYDPIANDADFRVTLPTEKMDELRADWRTREKQILVDANKHLWERFSEIVTHANERLSKDGAKFHYTLPQSLADFKDVLSGLNITDDQLLSNLAADAAKIADVPLDQLRKDSDVRAKAAKEQAVVLEKIQDKMKDFVQ